MNIDWTISIGTLIQVAVFSVSTLAIVFAVLFDVRQLKREVGRLTVRIETLGNVLIDLAKVEGRFETLESRLARTESDIDDLRHGHGFILEVPSRITPPAPRR